MLASTYAEVDLADGSGGLRFMIQDRPVVVEMGEKAWRAKCPELLDSGVVRFQVHDFFAPQPVADVAVFILRVVLHDWPDAFAQRILLRLREAAAPHTRLVLAGFVLLLACVDDFGVGEDVAGSGARDSSAGGEKQRSGDSARRTGSPRWRVREDVGARAAAGESQQGERECVLDGLGKGGGWALTRLN
ncbi:hypothetical protein K438DRAFT_2028593 [Mycena galopus ATCC 62051]|nr:hypothetical protein K438DRAFT_2028593 [Mycena galopus ATCC 62051]